MMVFLRLICFLVACCSAVHVSVKDNGPNNRYCIILDANVTGTVHYFNFKNELVPYEFVVNGSVGSTGKCHEVLKNDSIEYVDISFLPNDITPFPARERWNIKLTFESKSSVSPPAKSFEIADYKLIAIFYPDLFNSTTQSIIYNREGDANLEWGASDRHAFQCTSSPLTLTNSSQLVFSELKVVAFGMFDNDTFPSAQEFELCQLDMRTSDLVPIIVGACLAGLVIVVLIAYIIGRARAKRQGYASV